jgi:osmotically-inducible protein OsmY
MRFIKFVVLAAAGLVGCEKIDTSPPISGTGSQTPAASDRAATKAPAPDNTAVNRRDSDSNAKTPINQNENQRDINLVAEIRKQILDVDNLSVNARNAKVIVQDGKVTLRGPVSSEAERETIAKIATQVAGEGNVDNQLEVADSATAAANASKTER